MTPAASADANAEGVPPPVDPAVDGAPVAPEGAPTDPAVEAVDGGARPSGEPGGARPSGEPSEQAPVAERTTSSSPEGACKDREIALGTAIDALDRTCKADRDCEVYQPGCPFGCYKAIAKAADRSAVDGARKAFTDGGCETCVYRCLPQPPVKCKAGVCELIEAAPAK